uniref:COCA1 n=1 Tax=Schistocephalus solidus TaxID=70667 RepID=A0A183TDE2_SCHSO
LAATGLRAEWTQNDSSGPEILAYTYKLTKVSTGSLAQMGYLPVTARSVVLKNLVPFTDYALEVSANGIYTHGIARMTAKTAPGVPGNVQELKAAKKSTASLEATWKEPLNAPGDISSYRCVLYSGSFPTEWQTTKGTSVTFRGLDESNVYRVGVSATIDPIDQNIGGGTGPESLSNFVSFHEEEMPKLDPPVDASAKPAGSNAIALSWKPPTSSNVPVYYYKIIITDDEGVARTEVAAEISTFRLLMGLKPETTYKIVMKSIGLQTESEPTRPVSATTSPGVPSMPQKVAAKFVSASQVQVSWIKPNYVGSGVTGYNVTMRQGGMELKSQDVENSATSCIITDLPEFAELIFVVAAKSKEGIGEAALSNTLYTQEQYSIDIVVAYLVVSCDDKAVIRPVIDVAARPGHQQMLSNSPVNENTAQQVPAP